MFAKIPSSESVDFYANLFPKLTVPKIGQVKFVFVTVAPKYIQNSGEIWTKILQYLLRENREIRRFDVRSLKSKNEAWVLSRHDRGHTLQDWIKDLNSGMVRAIFLFRPVR